MLKVNFPFFHSETVEIEHLKLGLGFMLKVFHFLLYHFLLYTLIFYGNFILWHIQL